VAEVQKLNEILKIREEQLRAKIERKRLLRIRTKFSISRRGENVTFQEAKGWVFQPKCSPCFKGYPG
jgi:hypothetical protein